MMKTRVKTLFATVLLVCSIALFSCSTGMNTMFDSYNGNFNSSALVKSDEPGDEGFDASLMLLPAYAIRDDASLDLTAPPNCDTYSWKIYTRDENIAKEQADPELNHYNTRVILRNVTDTNQFFSLHVPDTILKNDTYKLVLTVTITKNNTTYTYEDFCSVVIYTAISGT